MRFLKRYLPKTLFGRSLLIIVTPLILVQLVTTWIFFDRHWDTVSRRLSSGVAGEIVTVIDLIRPIDDPEERQRTLDALAPPLNLRLSFMPEAILPNTLPPDVAGFYDQWLELAIKEEVRRPFHIRSTGLNAPRTVDVQLGDGILRVIVPRKRLFTSTTYIVLIWMAGTSLILFAVASLFMRNQVRPIRRLAAAADAFGKGRDIGNFKIVGAAEVRQAARAFRVMRDRIMRQVAQRTEMLAGVSHDLRTPLTRMRLQLAFLPPGPEVDELEGDIAEMERMLEGYLAFARGEGVEIPEPTDLGALVEDVANNAVRGGATVERTVDEGLVLPLRAHAFRRCLSNLIGNAVRYGDHAWIEAHRVGPVVEVLVDDDGPGIPPESREAVFRPFHRLDRSRNPERGGVGLGLSIARDVVHAHGGQITLSDSPRGGLRARLTVPV